MDVSVIVPYHKRKELFLNQLDSLRRSDYPREKFEVILVEDGSEDFRRHDFGGEPIRMKYFWNEKLDPTCHTPPRNKGIALAEGNLLVFLDCDQIVHPGFIGDHVEFCRKHGGDVLQIGTRKELLPDQDVANLETARYEEDVRVDLFRTFRSDGTGMAAMWANVWSHNISVPRKFVTSFGGFDEGFRHWGLEDQEFGLRMERNGAKIRYNPRVEVYHQHHKPAWGARVRAGWLGNYAHLVEKYPDDLRVKAIALLGEVLDPSMGIKIRIERARDLSKVFYTKMEVVTRCVAGLPFDDFCLDGFPEEPSAFFRHGAGKWF